MLLTILAIYILIGCAIILMIAKHNPDLPAAFNKYNDFDWVFGCCVGLILSIVTWPVIIAKGIIRAFTD